MDVSSDGQTSFHTTLQMVTKQGSKLFPVKVDPGADVNTILLTKYKKLFQAHFTKAGNLRKRHYIQQDIPGQCMMRHPNSS